MAVIVDFNSHSILYGDSLNQEPPNDMLAILHWWTHHHTGHHFTTCPLEITYQKDAFSCSLLSFNALAHHFLPMEYPLIAASNVRNGWLKILLDIIGHHLDQAGVPHLQGWTLLTSSLYLIELRACQSRISVHLLSIQNRCLPRPIRKSFNTITYLLNAIRVPTWHFDRNRV